MKIEAVPICFSSLKLDEASLRIPVYHEPHYEVEVSRASSGLVRSGSPSRDRRHERHGSSQVLQPFKAFETAFGFMQSRIVTTVSCLRFERSTDVFISS
ncbi:hypothetical protein NL676_019565 [Syzygium grande]|nr:hypothetical protein NL676_019565 [Syzygium grande]